jgi:hypothetical protein
MDTTTTLAPSALATMRNTPAVLQALLAGQPDDVLLRPNPEGWSIKDIVAHMHDAESIAFTVRIGRILDEEQPAIASIDPDGRIRAGGYAERDLPELLAELAERRPGHLAWVQSLTAEQLARVGQHDRAGAITPAAIIHQWAYHELAHVRQIMEQLQAGLTPGMANTRVFYPESQELLAQMQRA